MTTTPTRPATSSPDMDQRLELLARAHGTFPDLDTSQLMNIVDWAQSASAPLNSDALEHAAQVLAKADEGVDWITAHPSTRSRYRGLITHTIAAYLAAAK